MKFITLVHSSFTLLNHFDPAVTQPHRPLSYENANAMALARFFDPRYKLWEHMLQLFLIILAIALTGAHINLPGAIYSRAEIMTIAMVCKSNLEEIKS